MSGEITVWRLGRVEYDDGLKLQELFGKARAAEQIGDVLLLLEHSPVLTLGRSAKRSNIVASDETLRELDVSVFETNRGGDVTYHGPGQLVGYPIFKLPEGRKDVRRYVRDIEETIIRTVAHWGITAGRIPKWAGVWLGDEADPDARKIAAIGVHIARWQTSHGFALNVNTQLEHFRLIVPCGIEEKGVTSISREVGQPISFEEVEAEIAKHYGEVFDATLKWTHPEQKTVSVVVTRGDGPSTKVLLLKRTDARGGFWQIVTGKVEAGESPEQAAPRELHEETGRALPVRSLDYVHSFAFGDEAPPIILQETAFAARWPDDAADPVLDPTEHVAFEWVSPEEAYERLPFSGLKIAVRRATGR